MVELWFGIVILTVAAYVVLDGFDLGAGALHFVVGRTEAERREVLEAIGPYWDANEVWLVALGGTLFVAFPEVLAVGLSGFYFAIFLVIWSLVLRGVAIEFRRHTRDSLFLTLWDAVFSLSSALLCIFFGCALGNLLRGLPLGKDYWFSLPLFTDFSARLPLGILDYFTVCCGAFAFVALVLHGGAYLAWQGRAEVAGRARRAKRRCGVLLAILWPAMTLLTFRVSPPVFARFPERPLAWAFAALAILGLVVGIVREGRTAFLGSSAFLVGLLGATGASVFPLMLLSAADPARSLTAYGASSERAGLSVALAWWGVGFVLCLSYFTYLFRSQRTPPGARPVS
jgi:cytochrome d ubiquinol oxidase subunit II